MQKLKRIPLLQRLGIMRESLQLRVSMLLDDLRLSPKYPMTVVLTGTLAMICVAFWLAGCTQTRTVRPTLPPQAEPREIPVFQGQTYRDVIQYVIELKETAQASEADKAAIRRVYGE